MSKINVKIINKSANTLPEYATEGSAGMDLRASIAEPVVLKPLGRQPAPTGLFIELPTRNEAQRTPRSDPASKHRTPVLYSPLTIPSPYPASHKVTLPILPH